jgi:tetratricopeptide (TPR) repeat protein
MTTTSTAALTVRAPYPRKGDLPYAPAATDVPSRAGIRSRRRALELVGVVSGAGLAALSGAVMKSPWFALAGVGLLLAAFRSMNKRARDANARNQKLLAALDEGRLDEAIDGFRALAGSDGLRGPRLIALANLAVALSRKGDHDGALRIVALGESELKDDKRGRIGQMFALHAAHFFALQGDADGAEAWLDEAKRRGGDVELLATSWTPFLVLLRRGKYAEALAEIDGRWTLLEARLPSAWMRRVRVLRAFALTQLRRDAREVEGALEGARPFAPLDYACLDTEWPELRAFLVDQRLR